MSVATVVATFRKLIIEDNWLRRVFASDVMTDVRSFRPFEDQGEALHGRMSLCRSHRLRKREAQTPLCLSAGQIRTSPRGVYSLGYLNAEWGKVSARR